MKISCFLVDKMQAKNLIHCNRELYTYGLDNCFTIAINFFTTLLIAIIFRKIDIFIILILSFIPLRSFSGGIHCNSRFICYLLSSLIFGCILKFQDILAPQIPVIFVFSFCCSLYILLCSTADSKVRILELLEIRIFNHKKRVTILLLNIVLILFLFIRKFNYATTIMSSIILTAILVFIEHRGKKQL